MRDAPQIFIELLDFDSGDDEVPQWNAYSTEHTLRTYLATRLLSFTFEDHEKKKDLCKLKFRNDDFAMFDTPAFAKGQKLLVSFGWPGAMSAPRRVVVVGVKGGSEVEVTCHCTLELLDLDPQQRREVGVTDSEFVRKVAKEYGYSGTLADIEDTDIVHEVIVQSNLTDARMLHRLANANGFIFYIDGTGLHWHRRRTDMDPIRTFIYMTDPGEGTIIEPPRLEVKPGGFIKRVKVKARDPVTGEAVVGEAGSAESGQTSLGNEDLAGDLGTEISNRIERVIEEEEHAGGVMTKAEADAAASARYREKAADKYKMELTIIGDATVPAKSIVEVIGVAETFDGLYYVQSATHEIEPGAFTTVLKMMKDSLRKTNTGKTAQQGGARHPKVNGDSTPANQQEMVKILVLVPDEDGQPTPGIQYVDGASIYNTVFAQAAETYTDIAALSQNDRQAFMNDYNQTVLPDK